jgi:hypothetical protein
VLGGLDEKIVDEVVQRNGRFRWEEGFDAGSAP